MWYKTRLFGRLDFELEAQSVIEPLAARRGVRVDSAKRLTITLNTTRNLSTWPAASLQTWRRHDADSAQAPLRRPLHTYTHQHTRFWNLLSPPHPALICVIRFPTTLLRNLLLAPETIYTILSHTNWNNSNTCLHTEWYWIQVTTCTKDY